MGGELWEGCSYFGTELSVGLDPLLSHYFFLLFFRFFFEKWVTLKLGMEKIIKGLGQQLSWSLKLIILRMRIGTNFFNIMIKELVLSLILKLLSLRLQPNC